MKLIIGQINLNKQMSEHEKLLRGEFYNYQDPELREMHFNARKKLIRLNEYMTVPDKIMQDLFLSVGSNIILEPPFYCYYGKHITIGDRVFINACVQFYDDGPIQIGDDTYIGPNVCIYTALHPKNAEERIKPGTDSVKPVIIGKKVWICGSVIILPGVSIGDGSIIGAGSVVTRPIPERVQAQGNPCRVVN